MLVILCSIIPLMFRTTHGAHMKRLAIVTVKVNQHKLLTSINKEQSKFY